jgi:hypothetical protein
MGALVFVFSNLWGNRLGAAFAAKRCDPEKDNPYFCRVHAPGRHRGRDVPHHEPCGLRAFQCRTAGGSLAGQLPAIWAGTC